MANKQLLNTLCTYPVTIGGAATVYPGVWDSTACPPPSGVKTFSSSKPRLKVFNPCTDKIRVNTTLAANEITAIQLYNTSGTLIKKYAPSEIVTGLDISFLPGGLYVLKVGSVTGTIWNEKILKVK